MSVITINHVTKSFGDVTVLKEFTEEFQDGEFITFLGPSGCGKTTMLRIIAGFEKPTTGEIRIDGRVVSSKDVFVPPEKRGIGMVFQSYAVWPHMNVFDNVAYPLKIQKVPKAEIKEKVEEILEIVHLSQYANRMPSQLSGGQQQRVALGRALIGQPKLLLLDEPLSNLDAKLRLEMRYELQRLHVETGSTFVYVTHDQMEAMTLATKICLINNGVLQQYEAPLDVYNRPRNLFVADFVGNPSINFMEAKGRQRTDGSLELTVLDGEKAVFLPEKPLSMDRWFMERNQADEEAEKKKQEILKDKKAVEKGNKDETFKYHIAKVDESDYAVEDDPVITDEDFVIGVRPECIKLSPAGQGSLNATIYGAMPTGMESTVKLRVGDYLLTGVIFGGVTYQIGEKTGVDIEGNDILLFDRKSGKCVTAGKIQFVK